MPPQIPKGFDALPPPPLPSTYEGFRQWFPNFLRNILANGDVRNAIAGEGITVAGDATTPGTISVSTEVMNLFAKSFVLAPGSASSLLDDYRSLAAGAG